MIITHKTINEYLLDILKYGKIISSKKTRNINEGDSIYNSTSYIFYNTMPKNKIKDLCTPTIIFDYSILLNKTFYISKSHTGAKKEREKKKILTSHKEKLYEILKKLYTYSSKFKFKKMPSYFTCYQEIFTKHELLLDDAKYLYVSKDFSKIKKVEKIIEEKYPYLEIIYH